MNNTVPPGYKQTEVGVIPEEWEVDTVGNFCSISVGRDLKEQSYSPVTDQKYRYPIYSNTVENFGLYGFYDFAEYQGDSLTVVGRGIGLGTAFARSGGFGAIGRLLVLFPNSKADPAFLAEYINFFVTIFDESSGIPQLTGLSFAKYKLPLPPLPEQRTIAAALSDVDALIASLDKLIAKKRDMKQAAMQELLTGKRRLPGFDIVGAYGNTPNSRGTCTTVKSGECHSPLHDVPDGWEVKRMGEVLKVRHGKSQHDVVARDGRFPILATGGEIGRTNHYLYDKPSVLIGRKGTIDTPQFVDSPFWTIDTLFFTEIVDSAAPKFIYYKFNTINWYNYNEASGVPSLNASTIESIEFNCPPLPEQTAIAAILSDMDTEIASLEQKRDKTRLLKQGMMQELLTGRIRLV